MGKVKTRLADALGQNAALRIYNKLLDHTHSITKEVSVDKYIFYADFINEDDLWENEIYYRQLQNGSNLGERMKNAFRFLFDKGYKEIVIIGSDCYELTEEILLIAFNDLRQNSVTIGPATDGGYYLLGMNTFLPQLFENKNWSNPGLFNDTIKQLSQLNILYRTLPVLNDVDEEKDISFAY